tara:strand:- start:27593 stop:27964 length:372 start_codon:yes stop_codon:yes gene_type:complete
MLVSSYVQAADVLVFTDQKHAVVAPNDVPVIHLDAPAEFEAELTSGLPADSQRAEAIVRQHLGDGGTELQARLASAYQGVVDAWHLGITKLPAIVVERRYVVYGDADVARAIAAIEAYKREQQ